MSEQSRKEAQEMVQKWIEADKHEPPNPPLDVESVQIGPSPVVAEVRRAPIDMEGEPKVLTLVEQLSGHAGSLKAKWEQKAGTYRDVQIAALLEKAAAEVARLTAERTDLEMAVAQLRGMNDFLSGQPRDMPYMDGGEATSHMQLNFAWCLGYDLVTESVLWKLLVGRADRSAERSQQTANTLEALRTRLRGLEQQWRKQADVKLSGKSHERGYVKGWDDAKRQNSDELARLLTTPEEPRDGDERL